MTRRKRCIWHLVTNQYGKVYSKYSGDNNGAGDTVHKWILHACFGAESTEEFDLLWREMQNWIDSRRQQRHIRGFMYTVLEDFMAAVYAERYGTFKYQTVNNGLYWYISGITSPFVSVRRAPTRRQRPVATNPSTALSREQQPSAIQHRSTRLQSWTVDGKSSAE